MIYLLTIQVNYLSFPLLQHRAGLRNIEILHITRIFNYL